MIKLFCSSIILTLFTILKSFAQSDHDYVVTVNNDTLHNRFVVKVNPGENVIKLTDSDSWQHWEFPLDSLRYFYFKNTGWYLAEKMENPKDSNKPRMFDKQKNFFDLLSKKRKEVSIYDIFFPESRDNETYNLGNWGSVIGTRTQTKVRVNTKGINSWYEYEFTHYSSSVLGKNSMMYLYNDNLGLTKIGFLDPDYYLKVQVEALSEIFTAYLGDRPDLLNPFLADKKFDYDHIHRFLKKYFSK
ncbi:hypothetical protein [Rhizosphaericola mali]|uniref:SH3 domain-containing protein n=1 Tax=Rhizosphaericola mali TaxID=2545455 RepID=A0A5P2FV22_9BACT|nr:hypothetical protein [Rhizosphaericola mali]QES87326.1 hypothetical protein E0W69_001165 [Rhizosphaericola mali]